MIKAVIFDQDGTIIDSSAMLAERHKLTAKKLGLRPFDEEAFRRMSGYGCHHQLKVLWPEIEPEKFIECYATTKTAPYPAVRGAIETVRQLRERYPLGVVTGTPGRLAREKLADAGFELAWFRFVHGEEDLVANKPDGRAFEKALGILGLEPAEVVYIGDSANDYLAARNAGIGFIGVLTGHGTREDFNGARVIGSVAELPKIL